MGDNTLILPYRDSHILCIGSVLSQTTLAAVTQFLGLPSYIVIGKVLCEPYIAVYSGAYNSC